MVRAGDPFPLLERCLEERSGGEVVLVHMLKQNIKSEDELGRVPVVDVACFYLDRGP